MRNLRALVTATLLGRNEVASFGDLSLYETHLRIDGDVSKSGRYLPSRVRLRLQTTTEEFITVQEAERETGFTARKLRYLCSTVFTKAKRKTKHKYGPWLINKVELKSYLDRHEER